LEEDIVGFCTFCGAELSGALKFCAKCGHPVGAGGDGASGGRPSKKPQIPDFSEFVPDDSEAEWQRFFQKAREVALPISDWARFAREKYQITREIDGDASEIFEADFGTLWVKRHDYDGPDIDLSSLVGGYIATTNHTFLLLPVGSDSIDPDADEVLVSKKNWSKDFGEYGAAWYSEMMFDCPRCLSIYSVRSEEDSYYADSDADPNCPACSGEGFITFEFESTDESQ
jgi:hypothetical protein